MLTISPAQLAANQANSQQSTGPRTPEGKAKSSVNALRTGLTGRTILLSAAEADAYELHLARFACDLNPVGDRETELVQSLADTQWRLNRIPILEAGIYAARRIEHGDMFLDEADENVRALLLQTYIWETNRRVFNNLSLQESRLRRHYAHDLAELKALQQQRSEAEASSKVALPESVLTTMSPVRANGFEFSTVRTISAPAPIAAPKTDADNRLDSSHRAA